MAKLSIGWNRSVTSNIESNLKGSNIAGSFQSIRVTLRAWKSLHAKQ